MDDVKQSVSSSDYLKLRSFVKKQMQSILDKIDEDMKKEGSTVMFETMTTPEKITYVIDEVGTYAGLSVNDMRGYKKKLHLTKWIKIICYILQDKLRVSVADIRIALNYKYNQNVQFHTDTIRQSLSVNEKNNDIVISLNEILKRLNLKQ